MKNTILITVLTIILLASCKETPKNENEATPDNKPKTENNLEMQQKQDSIEAVREEYRKLDSIQQVKSHGHAH